MQTEHPPGTAEWLSELLARDYLERGREVRNGFRSGRVVFGYGQDANAESIATSHKNEKLSQIAGVFEELQSSPLARRFIRHKPKLYIVDSNNIFLPIGMAVAEKFVLIERSAANDLSLDVIKGVLAHELAHLMACDMHGRRGRNYHQPSEMRRASELRADKIATFLLGQEKEPSKWLQCYCEYDLNRAIKEGRKAIVSSMKKDFSEGSVSHPSLEERKENINATKQRMQTIEGMAEVEAELVHCLDTEHRNLFRHRYSRPGGVTRG